jgi:penicillin-binding protein 1A
MVARLVGIATALIYPELPLLDKLADYRPKLPLQIYSENGYLIRECGEGHRPALNRKCTTYFSYHRYGKDY